LDKTHAILWEYKKLATSSSGWKSYGTSKLAKIESVNKNHKMLKLQMAVTFLKQGILM
jgi:hypothetical protein